MSSTAAVERDWSQGDMLTALVASLTDYAVLLLDDNGHVRSWNAGAERIKRYRAEEILGRHVSTFYTPEDVAAGVPARHLGQAAEAGRVTYEGWWVRRDGTRFWADVVITALTDDHGRPCGYGTVTRDLSERHAAQQALVASESLHRKILQSAGEATGLIDRQGRFTYVNPALMRLLHASAAQLIGQPAVHFLSAADREIVIGHVLSARPLPGHREVTLTTASGHTAYALLALKPVSAEAMLVLLTDVTAQREAERQQARELLHDKLTGLPNSRLALDRLERARAFSYDTSLDVAAILLDVDGFHQVNAVAGREGADGVLVAVAAALASRLTPSDTVARWGADEFLVLREGVLDGPEARDLAVQLMRDVAEFTGVGPFPVTVSAGVSLIGEGDAETAIRNSETALAQAKARGHGHVRLYQPHLFPQTSFALPAELLRAVQEDQLVVHYQPLVDLASGRPLKVEALVRWQHPRDGLLPPGSFLPLAEAAGLITQIGLWVLERACRDIQAWAGEPLALTVNVAPEQLLAPDIADVVLDVLSRTGLPATRLVLEITENAIVEDVKTAVRAMSRLREAGVQIALDDFGTGYSGLSHLRAFPVDILKIDRSFISAIEEPDSRAIVSSVISLAAGLGVPAVAEGVETWQQRRVLLDLGCSIGQGYAFSPAVPYGELAAVCSRLEGRVRARNDEPGQSRSRREPPAGPELAPSEAGLILELHRGGASLATIAAQLNGEGRRRPDGRRWHATYIARVLQTLVSH